MHFSRYESREHIGGIAPILIGFSLLVLVTVLISAGAAWAAMSAVVPAGASSATAPAVSLDTPNCDPAWVVIASPDAGSYNDVLQGVSAVAANDVWAVGSYFDGSGTTRTLTEHWNGTAWSVVASPNIGATGSFLQGVSAVTSNSVWAVGSGSGQSLIEHWDGTAWSVVTSPNVGTNGNAFYAIATLAANDMWAVGSYNDSNFTQQTLTEHWNGTAWSVVASPNVGTGSNSLDGVSTITSSDIWAVGSYDNTSANQQTLTEHWNGTAWNVVTSPNFGAGSNSLEDVTAISSNDVWAVGFYDSSGFKTLTIHWDGSIWSVVSSPNVGTSYNNLFAVTAVSANDVWAVGSSSSGTAQTLTEHWDGTAWSVVASPNAGTGYSELYGVTAISSTDVWAVGYYADGGPNLTLVEHYSTICPPTSTPTATSTRTPTPTATVCIPGWSVVDNPTPGYEPSLLDVTAISSDNIWAVGSYRNSNLGVDQTLIEHWDEGTWNLVSSPNVGVDYNYLYGVSAVSATDIWAVGSHTTTGLYATLIEHWDGSAWSIVSSPNVGGTGSYLEAVKAISPNDVWAVGYYNNSSYIPQTLTMHWDGSTWSVVSSPNVGTADNKLYGVTAISSADVWAVGVGSNQTLTEHWNGSTWSVVASPSIGPTANVLEDVTTISSTDIWAVGFYYDTGTNVDKTLTEHWNGSAWSTTDSPDVGDGDNFLGGVTALSSGDVWAVGNYGTSNFHGTLTEHWDGSAWSVVTSPSPGDYDNVFFGVTAISSDDVWAVGNYLSAAQALIERYSGLCATSTPTATATNTAVSANTPTPTGSPTNTPTATNTGTHTATYTPTYVPTGTPVATDTIVATGTATMSETPTTCTISFEDVLSTSTFYPYVHCLACLGIINGYPCGGAGEPCDATNDPYFRPSNPVTRGQLSKIVSNSAGFSDAQPDQLFEDVPVGSTFHDFVGRLSTRGYINGYPCGGVGEPCGPENFPYFRPNNNATRGQISKIVSNAAGFTDLPGSQLFEDVPVGSTFYDYVQRLASRGIINGYPCGGVGEPCGSDNLPYFRPNNNATRGQTSKIVSSAFFPDCQSNGETQR